MNEYWHRLLEPTIAAARSTFPIVVITGPRQSGKSTLLKHVVAADEASCISLEDPNLRALIMENPTGYLAQLKPPVILDELQYLPELATHVKILVDRNRQPGTFFITGSQQFALMKNVAESLAGRAAILSLPPLQLRERTDIRTLSDFLTGSSYPEPAVNAGVNRSIWYSSYVQTYLEKDLRTMLNIADLRDFERFMRFLAARTGTILNMSECAKELGISVPTVKRWISALEASYIVFLLPPFFENVGKRIVKSPKLYFYDIGLVNYLLRIPDAHYILNSPFLGQLFETAVISEMMKKKYAEGVKPDIYYWRTQSGVEIDMLVAEGSGYVPYEIKSASLIKPPMYRNLKYWQTLMKSDADAFLITDCGSSVPLPEGIQNMHWSAI